jgi:hypothetical protein
MYDRYKLLRFQKCILIVDTFHPLYFELGEAIVQKPFVIAYWDGYKTSTLSDATWEFANFQEDQAKYLLDILNLEN